MGDNSTSLVGAIKGPVTVIVLAAISWFLFWEVIQPALASLSPIFVYKGDIWTGRAPDTPVGAALIATTLLVLLAAFLLRVLVYKGVDEFIDTLQAIYILVILLPFSIVVEDILPVFGIDHWESDSTQDDSQDDDL